MEKTLTKAHGNWVDGKRFFNRMRELEIMHERFKEGGHTLLTAQRRMGKTSLVRELKRQLLASGEAAAVFVDLENAFSAADAIKELSLATRECENIWSKVRNIFLNALDGMAERVEEVNAGEIGVKLRAGLDAGNWEQKGDEIFMALADQELPVLLAIDELPILINRILKGEDYQITPERRVATDQFMSWLRKNAQTHKGKVRIILSGSIGLEPVLRQAGLSAHANVFPSFELRPWSQETATACLHALAEKYEIKLEEGVCELACNCLGCCIPHHVQMFFDHLHEEIRCSGRQSINTKDIKTVYDTYMLGIRGQAELDHYEERLKLVLGSEYYTCALDLLTEAAVNGKLSREGIHFFADYYAAQLEEDNTLDVIREIIYVLEHDGYLHQTAQGYCYVSKLLKDWWKARHENFYVSIKERSCKQ